MNRFSAGGWRTRAPRLLAPAVALLLVLHAAFSLAPALVRIRNDFANYYVPARMILSGRPLDRVYDRSSFQTEIRRAGISRLGSFIPQPPANALLLLPFAGLPPGAAKAAWTAWLALAMLAAFLALRPLIPVSPWLLGMVFLLPTSSLRNALLYGQPYPLLLLLLCLSLAALVRGRPFLAGVLLSPVLVLKLYGIPFLLHFLWTRRWRAAAGLVVGALLLTLMSLACGGVAVHAIYARQMLPASLAGEVWDPYSPVWQSVSSLAHRLFQADPDLNPLPVADRPGVARALSRGIAVVLLLLSILASAPKSDPRRLRREWAALTLGSLAASPLTGSYHFVLLVLPVAILVSEAQASAARWKVPALLVLLAFATSPAPHHFARFACGWGNLLAYPRLAAVLLLLASALRPMLSTGRALAALGGGLVLGLSALPAAVEEAWIRVGEARGYLLAEPVACEGGLAWVTVQGERLVVHGPGGRILEGPEDTFAPRCVQGRLVTRSTQEAKETREGWIAGALPEPGLAPGEADPADLDTAEGVVVIADPITGSLRERDRATGNERVLARGLLRYPRLSPDGAWVAYQSWERGSWDIRAVERSTGRTVRVTAHASNEVEPSWMPGNDAIVFASDRRRGLGSTALYTVAFRP